MPDTDEVRVSDLHQSCTFNVIYHPTSNSPLCNKPATSLVMVTDAPRVSQPPKWRCDEHEGMVSRDERGEVVTAMPRELADSLTDRRLGKPGNPIRAWLDMPPHDEPY